MELLLVLAFVIVVFGFYFISKFNKNKEIQNKNIKYLRNLMKENNKNEVTENVINQIESCTAWQYIKTNVKYEIDVGNNKRISVSSSYDRKNNFLSFLKSCEDALHKYEQDNKLTSYCDITSILRVFKK